MEYTKYETARVLGARALQIAMGAPLLLKRPKEVFDPIDLAMKELDKGILPITIKRPRPSKLEI